MKQLCRLLIILLAILAFVLPPLGLWADQPSAPARELALAPGLAEAHGLRSHALGQGAPAPAPDAAAPMWGLDAVTLFPVADACVIQNAPTTNAGSTIDMWVGRDEDETNMGVLRSLVRFDVSSIPAGSTITSATLRVYLAGYWDYRNRRRTVTSYRLGGSWAEGSVNWNNCPASAESYGSVDTISDGVWKYYDLDITTLVQAWVSGAYSNYGLMLRGPEISGAESSTRVFLTREEGETGEFRPQLVINYTAGGPTPTATATVTPSPTATSTPSATPSATATVEIIKHRAFLPLAIK